MEGSWNVKPLAVPTASVSSVVSTMVSASPPVTRTIGGVPYFRLYIWLKPHGSKRLGMTNISVPASI